MDDHDLLIRIDERTENIENLVKEHDVDIDKLKMWKNRTKGAISIISGIVGLISLVLIYIIDSLKKILWM